VEITLLTLLHVLVFVYWLGADLGAFYAATIVTDPAQPVPARAAAAKVLTGVDMAPRTALIMAFPTGLALAGAKGWIAIGTTTMAAVWVASAIWLAIVWTLHFRSRADRLRRVDLAVRWSAGIGLIAAVAAAIIWQAAIPLFILSKWLILASAIFCGLGIRAALAPFFPAFAGMLREGANDDRNAAIADAIGRARPIVLLLWFLLLGAAGLGIAKPA
jgi:hypothetical protein